MSYELFNRYPFLEETIHREALGQWPTPLQTLPALTRSLEGTPVLIKRDDLAHPLYGGNKVRKLELILADARRKGKREIITAGGLGSHHVLASAALGREVGLSTIGLFFCQPFTDHVRTNLLLECSFGTQMHFVKDYTGLVGGYLKTYVSRLLSGHAPYLLLPGGSSALSTLGYINCALELKSQLTEQGLPDPAAVFVAAGSGGSAAGLLAGMALAKMDSKLQAVRVVLPTILKPSRLLGLARKSLGLLSSLGVDIGDAARTLPHRLHIEGGYLGEGYGFCTPEAENALKQVSELEGIPLEGCYTGKAMAALLDYCRNQANRKQNPRPVVFINTFSSTHQAPEDTSTDIKNLPPEFSCLFEGKARRCHCGLKKINRSFCEEVHEGTWLSQR